MRRIALLLLATALATLCAAQQRKGKRGGADVVVLQLHVSRGPQDVTLDGRVRNGAARTLKGLILVFEFLGPSGELLTQQKTQVVEDDLESGAEAGFNVKTINPPRSVRIRLDAFDTDGRTLRIDKPGPYIIE